MFIRNDLLGVSVYTTWKNVGGGVEYVNYGIFKSKFGLLLAILVGDMQCFNKEEPYYSSLHIWDKIHNFYTGAVIIGSPGEWKAFPVLIFNNPYPNAVSCDLTCL